MNESKRNIKGYKRKNVIWKWRIRSWKFFKRYGSNFWNQALDAGATAVIISNIQISKEEKEKYKDKTIIQVEDTFEALYEIAKYKRSLYNIPVIAVTGSVGKTSTKDIIASVVSQKYKTLKTEGNNNNNIGLPLTILKLKDHEALVLKTGIVDGEVVGEDTIQKLALLPNKEGMLAKFASTLNAPVIKFAMTVKALAEAKENGTVKSAEEAPAEAVEEPAAEAAAE